MQGRGKSTKDHARGERGPVRVCRHVGLAASPLPARFRGPLLAVALSVSWRCHHNAEVTQSVRVRTLAGAGPGETSLWRFPAISVTSCLQGRRWPPGDSRGRPTTRLPSQVPSGLSNPKLPHPPKHAFTTRILKRKPSGRAGAKEGPPRQSPTEAAAQGGTDESGREGPRGRGESFKKVIQTARQTWKTSRQRQV